MKLMDVIALTRAGYKKADIDKLILEEKEALIKSEEQEPEQKLEPLPDVEIPKKPVETLEDKTEAEEPVDEEKEALKAQIRKLQEDNSRRDISGSEDKRTDEQKLIDLFSDILN